MKVLDLECAQRHAFEGWFGSEDDFQNQLGRSLVACPICNDTQIVKRLSAPRLNLGGARNAGSTPAAEPEIPTDSPVAQPSGGDSVQRAWLSAVRRLMANTEDVGERFPEVARQMHYGETGERSIRGQASVQEAEALIDEGIDVMPFALPAALKGRLQ